MLDRVRALGAEVLSVSFTPPEKIAYYLEKHPLKFAAVSDPTRAAYRAFALGRASMLSFLRPGVIWGYLSKMLSGWMPTKPVDDDLFQLGGDFILDAEGRLIYAYASRDATDRPQASALIAELDRARDH